MTRPAKTQWDFGELFPTDATRKVLSVSELTAQVKRLLEKQVGQVWVSGEITNLRAQSRGHIYFTLKDATAQLACVLFRNQPVEHRELLADGQKVLLHGEVTVYEARGQYQLLVTGVELQGVGALQVAFEKLKQRLATEGFFTSERKRPLPRYPKRIGLVTSPTGAAIRDVLHVIQRRQPSLEVILAPCRVQGEGAAAEIAAAIRMLNEFHSALRIPQSALDLILVTRGGGSLEDLWAFNEEVVARAIFESAVPVVSAVGHEIDFTIADFVADVRAATPSAAAELITEGVFASREFVAEAGGQLAFLARQRVEGLRDDADALVHRLRLLHPRRRLNEQLQRLDDLQTGLFRACRQQLHAQQDQWRGVGQRLARLKPVLQLNQQRERLAIQAQRLVEHARSRLQVIRAHEETLEARLRLLSAENVLARGYSITSDAATGKVLRSASEVKPGQRLSTRLKTGTVRSVAEE